MAATPPPRRRPGAVPVATLAGLVVVLALAALAFGRATPGGLRDQGPLQAVAPPPVSRPLWPQLPASPPPATPATGATQEPPQPVPDLTVPGRDITAVDVRAVLAKDPKVGPEERQALASCTGCEVRAPEFRDLTGDGQPELITVVATPGRAVLHVYTLAEDRLLPVLQVQVLPTFTASTVGADLWLFEPTGVNVLTSSHYAWDGTRLALKERKDEGLGLLPPTAPEDGRPPTSKPEPGPAPARPTPFAPKQAVPEAVVPSPRAVRPSTAPSAPAASTAPAGAAVPAVPSAPVVLPEAKR
ncbi:hypothetical protein ABZW03_31745 [Kitasatospora sp. NPDC004799]|uniref:hypothetical protein n=1 Tax=Kitasatospora sp. NPDC004799 TaxID=3154460 RepID=UPI0033A5F2AC